MISLHETHFLLILFIVGLTTYMICSYYTDCNVDCKINYYKYENYHDKSKNPEPQNIHQVMTSTTDNYNKINDVKLDQIQNIDYPEKTYINNSYDLPLKEDVAIYNVGDRSSSHNGSIQSTDINAQRTDDEYINKLFKGLY